jgi:hypothetical protein
MTETSEIEPTCTGGDALLGSVRAVVAMDEGR